MSTSVVGAVHASTPALTQATEQQPDRVPQASKPVFDRAKEFCSRAWSATVTGVKKGSDAISLLFFRILNWVHPSLGAKAEIIFLRVSNIWASIKEAWRQQEIRKKINDLTTENRALHATVQQLSTVSEENNKLRLENSRLAPFEQLAATHEKLAQSLTRNQTNITDREAAVVRQRDLIIQQNEALKKELDALTTQRNTSASAMALTLVRDTALQTECARLQQELTVLRSQMQNSRELDQRLGSIAAGCAQLPQRSPQQQTALDHEIRELIPVLRQRIAGAREQFRHCQSHFPGDASAQIPFRTLDDVLEQLDEYLERVQQALHLHSLFPRPNYQPVKV